MIKMPIGLQRAIEQVDVCSLERHLGSDYEQEKARYQMTPGNFLFQLWNTFKSIGTIEVRNPYAELFIVPQHESKEIDHSLTIQWLDNTTFPWWEIVSPEWQTI